MISLFLENTSQNTFLQIQFYKLLLLESFWYEFCLSPFQDHLFRLSIDFTLFTFTRTMRWSTVRKSTNESNLLNLSLALISTWIIAALISSWTLEIFLAGSTRITFTLALGSIKGSSDVMVDSCFSSIKIPFKPPGEGWNNGRDICCAHVLGQLGLFLEILFSWLLWLIRTLLNFWDFYFLFPLMIWDRGIISLSSSESSDATTSFLLVTSFFSIFGSTSCFFLELHSFQKLHLQPNPASFFRIQQQNSWLYLLHEDYELQ